MLGKSYQLRFSASAGEDDACDERVLDINVSNENFACLGFLSM